MIPEAIIAMLACARLGAVHSVVFGGFAAKELASRIDDCAPKLLITSSCGIEVDKYSLAVFVVHCLHTNTSEINNRVIQYKPIVDHALELAKHKVPATVILQRPTHRVCNKTHT